MDSGLRAEKIKELEKNTEPCSSKEMIYKSTKARSMPVYEIPVDYLIFNQHNGRIGTFVKTYEKQHGPIDASTPEGEKEIIKFLWNSKKSRNNKQPFTAKRLRFRIC